MSTSLSAMRTGSPFGRPELEAQPSERPSREETRAKRASQRDRLMLAGYRTEASGAKKAGKSASVAQIQARAQARCALAIDGLPGQKTLDDGHELVLEHRSAPEIAQLGGLIEEEGRREHARPLGVHGPLERTERPRRHQELPAEAVLGSKQPRCLLGFRLVHGDEHHVDAAAG